MTSETDNSSVSHTPSPAARAKALLGFGVLSSLYLLYHHVKVNHGLQYEPSFCNLGGTFNCDAVAKSEYSELFGIPIASFGLIYYVFFLAFLFVAHNRGEERAGTGGGGMLVLALLSLPPTLLLASISVFKIGFVCIVCGLQYLLNIFLCVVALRDSTRSQGILQSCASGVRSLFAALFASRNTAIVLWLNLLCIVPIGLLAPSVLLSTVFVVDETEFDKATQALFEEWKKQPEVEIKVDSSPDSPTRDFILGPSSARVTLVEFSDFECPYCRRASHYLKKMVADANGWLRVVFKNFPLDGACHENSGGGWPHQHACSAALLARCAGESDDTAFWKMHDALFALEDWSAEAMLQLPGELGLSAEAINQCMSLPVQMHRVKEDVTLGSSLGIRSTPTFYVNGKKLKIRRLDDLPLLLEMIRKESEG